LIAIIFQTFYQIETQQQKIVTTKIETKQISCEKILIYDYNKKETVKECCMNDKAEIDSPNITIFTRDNAMEGLIMDHNKKIFYLPDKIGDAYPNLIYIRAINCSIKEISRRNFKGLTNLKDLQLYFNQIEKIAKVTFKDLKMLEILHLSDNQIKEVTIGVFNDLKKMKRLYLHRNQIEKVASGAFEGSNMIEDFSLGMKLLILTFFKFNFFFQLTTKSNI
jgi:Leucine-rich repeat (LRR) protein